jgi:hypothetical protein
VSRYRLGAAVLCALVLPAGLAAEERVRVGRAYDFTSGVLIYEERHVETLADGAVVADAVDYVDPQGRVFAAKRVDFNLHPLVPEFELVDERTGHLEALRRVGEGRLVVSYRERAEDELREASLAAPEAALADAGFDRFIAAHWDELVAGTVLVRQFLVPSHLGFMDFRIRRARDDAPGRVGFLLEIDSALLRLVVPAIAVVYDRSSRRLLRYQGLSNLRDERGENHTVRIEFEYAPNEDVVAQDGGRAREVSSPARRATGG